MRRVSMTLILLAFAAPCLAGATAPAATVSHGSLVERVQALEYDFSKRPDGSWSAPNRARNIRTGIDADGVRWTPRTGERTWTLGMRLVSLTQGETTLEVGPTPARRVGEARVERALPVGHEWYVNDSRGLEHGITLDRRIGESGPVEVALALDGGLVPRLGADARGVTFVTADGTDAIEYDGLRVWDATGATLRAHLELADETLRIVVDDTDATYPVVIDPLAGAPDWSAVGGQADSRFGVSVASAGDVNGDTYDDVIVGAEKFDNADVSEGKIFVFMGSASGLSIVPGWTAEGDVVGIRFGGAVASAGDLNDDGFDDVIVGARRFTDTQLSEGAAFVYYGSASGLDAGGTRPMGNTTNADWWAVGGQAEANFGKSVAAAGDVNGDTFPDILIGADEYTLGATDEGAVFVFHGDGNGLDLAGTRPKGSPANANATLVSGETEADFGVSARSAGDVNDDGFDDVIVGAWTLENNNIEEGRASLFLGGATGVAFNPVWFFDGLKDDAHVGISVDGAGDVNGDGFDDVIVGADSFTNGQVGEGSAFLFYGKPGGLLASTPDWRGEGEQIGALFGISVAGAGDLNADGFSDVIVGAPSFDNALLDDGRVYVYFGSEDGLALTAAHVIETPAPSTFLGIAVNGAGDVNGDGYDDIIAGATLVDDLFVNEGGAFVWHGCPDIDRDGVCDPDDNCVDDANPDQTDVDTDGIGDVCDPCDDMDNDGVCDEAPVFVQGSGSGEEVLVEFLFPMRYLGNPSDPGLTAGQWTSPLFNDSSWTLGQYGAGYERFPGGAENLLNAVVDDNSLSVYTRAEFVISDLSEIETLHITADYDDGYALWLNGTEVYRSSEMPGGLLDWNTDAVELHESSNGTQPVYHEPVDISVQGIPALVQGLNTMAVAAWNYNAVGPSSDLVIVPKLSYNRPPQTTIRYQPNFVDPALGTTWVQTGFDDSGWLEGNFGVGYDVQSGAGSAQDLVNTIVSPNSYSVYSRARFFAVKSAVESLWLGADYDDGYVAWLNGIEIYRSPEMPAGTPAWNTSPAPHESSNGATPDYGQLVDVSFPGLTALRDGENVLAIAVYNNGAPATDALVVVPRLSFNEEQVDNCLSDANPDQTDTDLDGAGDACDIDDDDDGILDDGDSSGSETDNRCTGGATTNCDDNCPLVDNVLQLDFDSDGIGDACDACPSDALNDQDADGVCGDVDNCSTMFNPTQADNEPDGQGDVCDPDDDNDGILDDGDGSGTIGDNRCTAGATTNCDDNCQFDINGTQTDADGDGFGFPCDCDPAAGAVWEQPGIVQIDTVGVTTVTWSPPADSGGTTVRYDTLRATNPSDFGSATCVEADGLDTTTTDAVPPPPGTLYSYVIRVENSCPTNNSSMGSDSFGTPRVGPACP